jgi:hypothetical protein
MNRLLVSLFLAVPLIPVSTAGMAQQQFDGRWSVRAIPEKGACRRAHDYTVVVENGVPRNAVSRRMADRATGGLEPDGRVRVSVQRRQAQVAITGKLAGRSGSGTWTIAGSIACSGRWTASKWG